MSKQRSRSITHIVFKTDKLSETKKFWEQAFEVENRSKQSGFLSYDINDFVVNFLETKEARSSEGCIGHIGVEFATRKSVDDEYRRVKEITKKDLKPPFGGEGKGPYRFYLADPNGINLEFESWEGCSD